MKIRLNSNKLVDITNISEDDILIEDIAHALSNICRYNGHCNHFYSVAEHSMYVALFAPRELRLSALLHDASETYVGDIPRPIKKKLPIFNTIEKAIQETIDRKFGVDVNHPLVKEVDNSMLATEYNQIMNISSAEEGIIYKPYSNIEIRCLTPERAKSKFLAYYAAYSNNRERVLL